MPVGVVEPTGEDDGAARGATGGGTESPGESHSFSGQRIDVWRLDRRIPIATQVRTKIVRDEQDDVGALFGLGFGT